MVTAGTYQPRVRKTLSAVAVANDFESLVRNTPYAIHQSKLQDLSYNNSSPESTSRSSSLSSRFLFLLNTLHRLHLLDDLLYSSLSII